jgi:hypothetical protein
MACVTMNRNQLDACEGHCSRCLAYSRMFRAEGPQKTNSIFRDLSLSGDLRQREGNSLEAVTFYEDAYDLVAVAYDPP